MAFREIYIEPDDFIGLQQVGRRYVGFVIGWGYAYIETAAIPPPNFNGYTHTANVPPAVEMGLPPYSYLPFK